MNSEIKKRVQTLREKKEKLITQSEKMNELKNMGRIKKYCDLYGDGRPSVLFPFLLNKMDYLLDPDNQEDFSKKKIEQRKIFNFIIRKIGPFFLKTNQIFEDRSELAQGDVDSFHIPDEPVIFAANHRFRDDILGTILAANRQSYVMFASLPQFYNTIEGLLLYGNGVVLINRKIKDSRKSSIYKSEKLLENGCDLIIFPEGVWNKSSNQISLPLWSGIYRIAKDTGTKIVPIIHYIKDPTYQLDKTQNAFHTVIDNPIDVKKYNQVECLEMIRESFSTWYYLMMEKYGNTTREELLQNHDYISVWEDSLRKRVLTADKYDFEIETSADYIPKDIFSAKDVFFPISEVTPTLQNVQDVLYAKKLVKEIESNDFQHRF